MSAALLANVVHGLVVAAKPAAPDVLPKPSELDMQLTSNPVTWASKLVRVLEVYVNPLFTTIPATPVPGARDGAPIAWNTATQIRKVLSDPATVAVALPATNHLPLSTVNNLSYKLRSFQRQTDVQDALNIYLAYMAADRVLPPALVTSKSAAKRAIRDLVAFEAFLVRISSAIAAAGAVGVSLAEALALYRVEGDLLAPMSSVHQTDKLPVNESMPVNKDGLLPNIYDRQHVSLTLRRGLWSYPYKTLAARLGLPPSIPPVPGAAEEQRVKCVALFDVMLVIGGVDVLATSTGMNYEKPEPIAFRKTIIEFIKNYRTAIGLPSVSLDPHFDFDAVFKDLKCTWPQDVNGNVDVNGRVVVAPQDPVLLASFALFVALLIFRRDHAHGGGPFIQPPPGLEYLAYHAQADRVAKEKDRFVYVLASAAVAAAKSSTSVFAPLKTALSPLALPTKLPKDPLTDPTDHISVFDKLTAAPTKFLDDATNAGRLAEFVLLAEQGDWSAYKEYRGNLARYRKLLEFYKALLA